VEGIQRIETVGARVRTTYGMLARISAVLEQTRTSADHLSNPCDVVVLIDPIGPSYHHTSSWASALSEAKDSDRFGSHAHTVDCPCGEPFTGPQPHWGWVAMGPSWDRADI
jgi:hypothetical protein